ncbi:IS3 family transposase [Alkaliphilus transvaalensis]|uniref:IS3 family transposase n=1 Tax=Alkaliphilus transvaalensis TaxID=114628 RepID=UPI0038BB7B4D
MAFQSLKIKQNRLSPLLSLGSHSFYLFNRGNCIVNIKFYNEKRLQKRLGCMAPLEYRNHASICACYFN